MAETPRDRLDRQVKHVEDRADEGAISEECRDALLEWADALDEGTVRNTVVNEDGEVQTYKPRTVEAYLRCLRICADDGLDPLEASAAEVNETLNAMHDDQGKSKSTLATYAAAVDSFYRYHDLGVDADDLVTFNADASPKHDETDMFTDEDVQALRRACGETGMATRNRALLELLIFTGQRIRALVTLRLGDVDVQEGYIYLNDDYDEEFGGLKGALERGRKRPMFGARKYVRDYIQYHRSDADPDDWLFIGDPSHWKTDPDDHWAAVSADHVLRRMGDAAGVDKPVNPHNFRHYCATVLYRDYDVDRDTIRMLFGHVEGSSSLEETYTHLFDEDYIRKAEEATGYREEEETKTFTPDTCPTCGELLEDHWRRCPACEELFGPTDDFEERLEEADETVTDKAVDSRDPNEIAAWKIIRDVVDDPEAVARRMADLDAK